jgi:hypothetical protein
LNGCVALSCPKIGYADQENCPVAAPVGPRTYPNDRAEANRDALLEDFLFDEHGPDGSPRVAIKVLYDGSDLGFQLIRSADWLILTGHRHLPGEP